MFHDLKIILVKNLKLKMRKKRERKKKQDTKLESVGAEFLVLGHLLIEKISAHKTYSNFPGYDLIAINPNAVTPKKNKVARIQVKSRWATNSDHSFTLKNLDCDFVVFAQLNCGWGFGKEKKRTDSGKKPPEFYILPIDEAIANRKGSWKRVKVRDIKKHESYKGNWKLIKDYLE